MDRVAIKKVNRAERLSILNLPTDTNWLVWWYGPLKKSKRSGEQPKVIVIFREIHVDGVLADKYCEQECSLTDLSFLRIGSVWKSGLCIAESIMEEKIFDVDFSYANNGWRINSFHKAHKEDAPLPYDFSCYPLNRCDDRSCLLEFLTYNMSKVIIPALEFFYRCYGNSDELKRTVLTYSKNEICNRLFSEANIEGEKVFYVKLRKRMNNKDAPFVSFFALDAFTQKAVDRIQRQLVGREGCETYLKVAPWFKGKARIKVKGFWLSDTKSFLGLSVTGVSLPEGYTVNFDRDNSNLVDEKADDRSKKAWDNVSARKIKTPDEIFSVDNAFNPDSGASGLEVEASAFEILGDSCVVVPLRKEKAKYVTGSKNENKTHSSYSVNESSGEDNDIGYMSTVSDYEEKTLCMESRGIVRDMWNAMIYLKKNSSQRMKSLEWYTPENLFSNSQEPKLVAIPEFDRNESEMEGDKISRTILNWPYLDVINKKDIRGFLISRVVIDNNTVYFMEIQRRIQNEEDVGSLSEAEKFKGLVFTLNDDTDIYKWVSLLAHEVRFVKGIVQKIVGKCPGTAMAYKHSPAQKEPVACYSALLNALSKVGITF